MVMTISSPATAAAALGATLPPALPRASSAAGTRSKPSTRWPALTRLAAIGPPMLPRPMKAMVLMTSSRLLFEDELALAQALKIARDLRRAHLGQRGMLPAR